MADWPWVLVAALPPILRVGLWAGVRGACSSGGLSKRRLGFRPGACVSLAGLPG